MLKCGSTGAPAQWTFGQTCGTSLQPQVTDTYGSVADSDLSSEERPSVDDGLNWRYLSLMSSSVLTYYTFLRKGFVCKFQWRLSKFVLVHISNWRTQNSVSLKYSSMVMLPSSVIVAGLPSNLQMSRPRIQHGIFLDRYDCPCSNQNFFCNSCLWQWNVT